MSILKPSFYKQTDSRWAKKGWNTTDGGYSTIGVAGCGSTAVANIVNALVKPITPPTVFKYACQKGYQTGNYGLYRSAIPKLLTHFGVKIVDIVPRSDKGRKKLKEYLQKNYFAIAIMGKGIWTNGGHYITAYYVDHEDKVYISDSASSADYRQKNSFSLFWDQQKDVSWLVIDPHKTQKTSTKDKSKTVKSYTLYTNNNNANVRKGRGANNKLIASLPQNTTLKVKNWSNGWWEIAAGKYKGKFISESNLSKYKTYTKIYRTQYLMNVREGYSTSSEVISKVEKGRSIKSTKQKGNWAYIPDKKGWICIKDSKHVYLREV